MKRTMKSLGLALIAALSVTAVLAPTVSAQFEFTSVPVTLTPSSVSTQKIQIKEGGTTVECTALSLDNSTQTTTPTTTITFEPTYSSCKDLFGQKVSVDTNGCDFVLHASKSFTSGSLTISCPFSTGLQITVGKLCSYEYDSQSFISLMSYVNFTSGGVTGEIELVPNLKSITSQLTTNHFPFLCSAGSDKGTYTGNFTLTGENNGSHVGVSVD